MSRQRCKFVNREFSHSKAKLPGWDKVLVRVRELEWRENVTTKKQSQCLNIVFNNKTIDAEIE